MATERRESQTQEPAPESNGENASTSSTPSPEGDPNSRTSERTATPAIQDIEDLVLFCNYMCFQASVNYIKEFFDECEKRDPKDHETELGRRCYKIHKEKKLTTSLHDNTSIICHILQIQSSVLTIIASRKVAFEPSIKKLCSAVTRLDEALKVVEADDFNAKDERNAEDERLMGISVPAIEYCSILREVHMVADMQHYTRNLPKEWTT
ncbi:hypothetical protein FGRMN_9026 [Fusarium graminum]|nr:hypothetical protein FGRMN_9026 [Fusarium graminum]